MISQLHSLSDESQVPAARVAAEPATPLFLVLWTRKWTVLLILLAFVGGGLAYLRLAVPLFTATSSIYVERTDVKVLSDGQGIATKSDSFLPTQVQILRSGPILTAALAKAGYQNMRTFADVKHPLLWLQEGKAFKVEIGKKDDVITVSLDSPYPQEAAEVVNAVVNEYVASRGKRQKVTAAEMLKVLNKEKAQRDAQLDALIEAMRRFKQENGVLSFQSEKSNIVIERLAKLSDSLTGLELELTQARSQYDALKSIIDKPASVSAYVQDLQTRSNTGGDKEYDDLRAQLGKYRLAMRTLSQVHGENSTPMATVRSDIGLLEEEITRKEASIAHSKLAQLEQYQKALEQNAAEVRSAFALQQKEALDLNSRAVEYGHLEDEVRRTEKQCGDLDSRIKEVMANSQEAGTLTIEVLEPASIPETPTHPRKVLVLAGVLIAGLFMGTTTALVRDWADPRFRTSEEVSSTLGIAILGVIPKLRRRMKSAARGQLVEGEPMSEAAEAYRSIRTALTFGAGETKTILLTSASPKDGKSTTASNLAIALSQAGHRTLLLDADLRRPVQHRVFGLGGEVGVCDAVSGRKTLREAIQPTGITHLDLLPCGPVPSNPSEILASKRFARIMAALAESYDRIVIDSPPVLAVTDARILAASADVTILVLRPSRSIRRRAPRVLSALENVGSRVVGAVVNGASRRGGIYQKDSYYSTRLQRGTTALTI